MTDATRKGFLTAVVVALGSWLTAALGGDVPSYSAGVLVLAACVLVTVRLGRGA